MYNKSTEILWIINMLLLNDNREPLQEYEIFNKEGNLRNSGRKRLTQKIRGYVSYIRGENPFKFPIRLYPEKILNYPKNDIFNIKITNYNFKFLKMYGNEMIGDQEKIYLETIDILNKNVDDQKLQIQEDMRLMQISNISYPNSSTDIRDKYGERGLKQILILMTEFIVIKIRIIKYLNQKI